MFVIIMTEISVMMSHREAGVIRTPVALVAPPLNGASRPKALTGLSRVLPALKSDFLICPQKNRRNLRLSRASVIGKHGLSYKACVHASLCLIFTFRME